MAIMNGLGGQVVRVVLLVEETFWAGSSRWKAGGRERSRDERGVER